MLKEFAQDTIENIEIINITILHMLIIHDKYGRTQNMFINAVIRTIARNTKFTNPTWIYHMTKSFSSSEKDESLLMLFFTNGAKNINPATAESIAWGEMLFFVVSIVNI